MFASWFSKVGRTSAPPVALAKLAVEALDARVLPSVAGGAGCLPPAPPSCPPVACHASQPKAPAKDAVKHCAPSNDNQDSLCLYGVKVGKGNDKSSHGKVDQCKPPKQNDSSKSNGGKQKSSHGKVDRCKPPKQNDSSKSNGGKQKSSHGRVDLCTPPKPVKCPPPKPPVACLPPAPRPTPCPTPTPPPPVVCLPPAPRPTPCPVPTTPPATPCENSNGGSNGGHSNGGKSNGGHSNGGKSNGGHSNGGKSNGGKSNGGDSNGSCYDDGYAMPGRASDMVRALCGV